MKKIILAAIMALTAVMAQAVPARIYQQSTVSLIDQSSTAVSVTGTLAETTMASINIPAGMIGPNGVLRITALFSLTNNANAKSPIIRLGGVTLQGSSIVNAASDQLITIVRNRGFQAQISFNSSLIGLGSSVASNFSSSINTMVDQPLVISALLTNVADTVTLEGYTVEVLVP